MNPSFSVFLLNLVKVHVKFWIDLESPEKESWLISKMFCYRFCQMNDLSGCSQKILPHSSAACLLFLNCCPSLPSWKTDRMRLWSELTAIWEVQEEGSYGRRQTGNGPAHLGSESGLGLLSQSESMSSPSPSLSLPIADRLRPDRARVCSSTHTHNTKKNNVRGIEREREKNTQNTCKANAEKERKEDKSKKNYTTPVHLVSVAGFLQYQVMALMFEHYGILMATFTHKLWLKLLFIPGISLDFGWVNNRCINQNYNHNWNLFGNIINVNKKRKW